MKTFTKAFTKLFFVICVLIYANPINAQIHSTSFGGDWDEVTTWIGITIPGPGDNVVINGTVNVVGLPSCNNITIALAGTLQNKSGTNRTLTVNGNITNQGTIKNNNWNLNLNIHGNISNNGTWQNLNTNFVGSADQNISSTTSFNGQNLISNKVTGFVHAISPLHFINTIIDFNGDSLYMDVGLDSIFLSSGHMREITILANASPWQVYCHESASAYVNDVNIEANDVVLDGTFEFETFFDIIGNVRVEGALQNRDGTNRTVTVTGNMTNNGIIQDNNWSCFLYITGNIFQNGIWTNNHTYLSGDVDQDLAFTQPFAGEYITNSNLNGKVISNSTLVFNSTIIDFNYDTLMFASGADSLIVNGDYFQEVVITKAASKTAGFLNITLNTGAYFHDMDIIGDNINLNGIFQYTAPINFYGHVTVEGTLENRNVANQTAYIYGNVTNNGVIQDNNWSCFLYITGDINQNGTWTNNHTYLSGDAGQDLAFTQTFSGENFTSNKITGHATASTQLWFANTVIDFNGDSLYMNVGNDSISLNGGHLQEMSILANASPFQVYCHQSNSCWYNDVIVEGDDVVLDGTFQFMTSFDIIGNARVEGILQNRNNTNQIITVDGNMTNNGVIQDNNWSCFLYITGDINQNGTWTNNHTYLSGDAGQDLAFTQTFSGENFTSNKITGYTTASTQLWFANTVIDFNGDSLYMNVGNDSISLNGGHLEDMSILANASPFQVYCHQSNNCWYDDVVIEGDDVVLDGIFQYMTFFDIIGNARVEGTLQNRSNTNQTVTVDGNMTNNGVIQDNYWNCYLHITGDLNQNGIWTNNHTYLTGVHFQFFNFTAPFNGEYLTNTITAFDVGFFISMSSLTFNNTIIDLNGDTIMFETAADSLVLNGGYFSDGTIIKVDYTKTSGFLNLTQTGNAYFQDMIIECVNINLNGTFRYKSPMSFYGNVAVEGIFQNHAGTNHTAYIYGNMTNSGTINNNYWNNTLYITGDISQDGIWSNLTTYFSGNSAQSLSQTKAFTGNTIIDTDPSSEIQGMTDLVFDNTDVDLGGATLLMKDYHILSIKSAWFKNADIVCNAFDLSMIGSSFLENVSLDNVTIYDWVKVKGSCVFSGNTTVEGTLSNDAGTNYTLHIDGDIHNNGFVQNNYWNLFLDIDGDIYNNGSWTNLWTKLNGYNGAFDQTIEIQNGNEITSQVQLFPKTAATYLWHWNNTSLVGNLNFSGANAQILKFLDPVSGVYAGTYNCLTNLGWSRNIFVTTNTVAAPAVELTILLEGPFNGTAMDTDLNSGGYLPLNQPYNNVPWNYWGSETVGAIPNANIVDWVYIEYRDAVDAASATEATRIGRDAGFLLNDGSVVGLNGVSNLFFSGSVVNNLYVVVYQRNHLGIMSSVPLIFSGGSYNYDFTTSAGQAYNSNQVNLGGGNFGMYGGDMNSNGTIDASDLSGQWNANAGTIGYLSGDANMDSQIDNKDKNDVWLGNDGESALIP